MPSRHVHVHAKILRIIHYTLHGKQNGESASGTCQQPAKVLRRIIPFSIDPLHVAHRSVYSFIRNFWHKGNPPQPCQRTGSGITTERVRSLPKQCTKGMLKPSITQNNMYINPQINKLASTTNSKINKPDLQCHQSQHDTAHKSTDL